MKRLLMAVVVTVACGACFLAGRVSAEEEASGGFPLPDWMQMGEEQEGFKKSVGSWNVVQKVWMAPGQPPMESKGSSKGSLLWGGRFLESKYHGDMMGMPFDGRLLMGFDRVDKEYVAVWIDSLSTYMSVSRGAEKDGKTTFKLNDPDFMTGKRKETDMVLEWIDEDTYRLTFLEAAGDGEARTTMEMTYRRVKE